MGEDVSAVDRSDPDGAAGSEGGAERRRGPWRSAAGALGVCFAASLLLLSLLGAAGTPYAVEAPGPVLDVLGEGRDGEPLISVEGRETYPTEGSLDLLTVSTSGGPGRDVVLAQVVSAWLDPVEEALPVGRVFAPDQTREDVDEARQAQMSSSQQAATAAALRELDVPVDVRLRVSGAAGEELPEGLERGDVITAVDGRPAPTVDDLRAGLQEVEPGAEVRLGLERDGADLEVAVTTSRGDDGRTVLGVLLDPEVQVPFEVDISIDDVGGPSAGMVFALGLVDLLTPGSLTGGLHVAGTGTVSAEGAVGPIGGIRQKLVGASRAGAEVFLAPAVNCDEVVGHVPDGMRVVAVSSLEQARSALEELADGGGQELPGCREALAAAG
ncbi:S16 family serine protease [Pseudokineococcus marinus]|uniref:endopeptidase La n=1 Tax=Pseudokineococcus marinus TaxID=351215 RepID=A0A849BNH8_9ACTN|nr:S16 family serine protease [Pseudokineococcus marinus]NNH22144.1 PDZ domain-containing protein [Pseudokineococcus marinus]